MTDAEQPEEILEPVDILEQLRTAGAAAMPALLRRLNDAVEGGGKVTRRHRCSKCANVDDVTIEVADVEEIRKLVEMFAKLWFQIQAAQKGDGLSAEATRLINDRSQMTDAELAEYIAKLEAELNG